MKQLSIFLSSLSIFSLSLASLSIQPLPTIAAGTLIKASTASVYYLASDGKRYAFPNAGTYATWYADFSTVRTISDQELSTYTLGGNVTDRPGVKLIKINTDPKVYAVSRGGVLHWVQTETLARQLYGTSWNRQIDDVSDGFFSNYTVSSPIANASEYVPTEQTQQTPTINIDKGLSEGDSIPLPVPAPVTGNPISGRYVGPLRTIHVNSESSMRDAVGAAIPGDVIKIAPGSYIFGQQWWIDRKGTAAHPIYIVADGARGSVNIRITDDEGVNVGGQATYLIFEDLEVHHTGNNVFHVQDGSHHVTLRNLNLHDAGPDGDVVKVNQAHHITIEGCDLARPAARADASANGWQEALDMMDVDDAVIRRNYIHDVGNLAGYVKGGSKRALIEENVIDNQRAGADGDPIWGIGGWSSPIHEPYEAIDTIFRRNVIMRGYYGGLALYDAKNTLIENNLFLNNNTSIMMARAGNAPSASTDGVQIRNNRIVDTRGTMPTVCTVQTHTMTNVSASGNAYWNNGHPIPPGDACHFTPSQEPGAQIQNPNIMQTNPTTYEQAMNLVNGL